jgi:hypothetical protein
MSVFGTEEFIEKWEFLIKLMGGLVRVTFSSSTLWNQKSITATWNCTDFMLFEDGSVAKTIKPRSKKKKVPTVSATVRGFYDFHSRHD